MNLLCNTLITPPSHSLSQSSNNSHLTSPFISKVDHWPALPSTSNGTSRSQAGHSRVDWSVSGCKDVKQGTGDEGRPKVEHEGENEEGEREGEDEGGCGRDLHHLMQSLDIVEHLHVLQVCNQCVCVCVCVCVCGPCCVPFYYNCIIHILMMIHTVVIYLHTICTCQHDLLTL